jgi:hypothetical protein
MYYICNNYYIIMGLNVKWLFWFIVSELNSRERVRVWRLIRKVGAELYRNRLRPSLQQGTTRGFSVGLPTDTRFQGGSVNLCLPERRIRKKTES